MIASSYWYRYIYDMRIGEKLRQWREGLGLHQTEVASRAGLSQSAWSDIENGKMGSISLDVALRIVEVTAESITLKDFPRPKGRRVRPVRPEQQPTVEEDSPSHAEAS